MKLETKIVIEIAELQGSDMVYQKMNFASVKDAFAYICRAYENPIVKMDDLPHLAPCLIIPYCALVRFYQR